MDEINWGQVKSALRTLLAFGAGIGVDHGWITSSQMQALLDPALLGALSTIGGLVIFSWGVWTHKKSNVVATVAAMPEVKKVEVLPTPEGRTLAAEVGTKPDAAVVVAPR